MCEGIVDMLRHVDEWVSDMSINWNLIHLAALSTPFREAKRDAAPNLTPPKKEKNVKFISNLNNNLIDLIKYSKEEKKKHNTTW